jgi:hypothetical protein
MGENVKSGCFEWLTDSSAIVPEICSHFIESIEGIEGIEGCREKNVESREGDLEENVSSPSNLDALKANLEALNDDRSLLVIDLGCGTSNLSADVAFGLKNLIRMKDEIRILKIDLPDVPHAHTHDTNEETEELTKSTTFHGCDLAVRAPEGRLIPQHLLEYKKKAIILTLDKVSCEEWRRKLKRAIPYRSTTRLPKN